MSIAKKTRRRKGAQTGDKSSSFRLERAESWSDLLPVLRSTYQIWNAGLSRSAYLELASVSLRHPWSRKNYHYWLAKVATEVVCSCKLYTLQAQAPGRQFKVAGVGAVFTQPEHRGHGYAAKMLEQLKSVNQASGYDAMLLFSDIDPAYYEKLGFEQFSDYDFHIWLNNPDIEATIISDPGFVQDMHDYEVDVSVIELGDITALNRHYVRYLARQPFGLERSESYWSYKIQRHAFLVEHSALNWPTPELLSLGGADGGYAIFEQGGKILRVLEVIGSDCARDAIWRHLLRTALLRGVALIRGWEGTAPKCMNSLKYAQRDGTHPMLLVLNERTDEWLERVPCGLLEFDHF